MPNRRQHLPDPHRARRHPPAAREQALQDSGERLSLAAGKCELGLLWDWQLRSDQIYASARASELHGLAEQLYDGASGDFLSSFLRANNARHWSSSANCDGQRDDFRVTYHACHADGNTRYHGKHRQELYRDSHGQPQVLQWC